MRLNEFFRWEGRVSRGWYFLLGTALFLIKYGLDWVVATKVFGLNWNVLHYLHIVPSNFFSPARSSYFVTLLAMSLPFIWAGVHLTAKRLRDAGLPLWLTLFFFIPLVNLLCFLILCILGSVPDKEGESPGEEAAASILDTPLISAIAAGVITALLLLGAVALSTLGLKTYGMALFVAAPFCQGLAAVLIYAYPRRRTWESCQWVVILSGILSGLGMMAFAMEGMICLLMAAPLMGGLAVFGGSLGHAIQENRWNAKSRPWILLLLVAFTPTLMGMEHVGQPKPPLYAVRSSIEIQADAASVWKNVVSFSELPDPKEWIFKTGLAYPVHATIEGQGVGALRRCTFTTGEFLEPIQVWDEPKLLRFSVDSNPMPMHEMNPFKEIHPPHLDGFFLSRQGQFLLTPSEEGGTHLEGTTWYEHGLWPAGYWRLWSDFIIHKIHLRVLEHIKNLSEKKV
jgi:uncharacterized membrane protein YhaH (DUF805 family)